MTQRLQPQTATAAPKVEPSRRLDVTFTEQRAAKAKSLGLTVEQYLRTLRRRAWRE